MSKESGWMGSVEYKREENKHTEHKWLLSRQVHNFIIYHHVRPQEKQAQAMSSFQNVKCVFEVSVEVSECW